MLVQLDVKRYSLLLDLDPYKIIAPKDILSIQALKLL
jgi:hypothetical protein